MEKYEELFNPSFLKKESAAKEACDNRPPLPKDAAVTMAYVPLQTDMITYDEDKALRRLSAMQFAMWEMREFLDTHPNCPDATALYNAYKEKYDTLAKEYEARFGPLVLNGANSDAWLQDPWPWEAGFDTDE